MYLYKGFLFQLAKALCLSAIVTEAAFPSIESQGPLPPSVLFLLVMFRTPGDLSGMVTEAYRRPLFSAQSQTLPISCTILLVMLGTPGNLIKPSSGLLSVAPTDFRNRCSETFRMFTEMLL